MEKKKKKRKAKGIFQVPDLSAGSTGRRDYEMESSVLSQSEPLGISRRIISRDFLLHGHREYFSQSEWVMFSYETVFQMCVDMLVNIKI